LPAVKLKKLAEKENEFNDLLNALDRYIGYVKKEHEEIVYFKPR
jgi:hypothetical protein